MSSTAHRKPGLISRIRDFFSNEPEDSPLPDTISKTIASPNILLEHIDAIRIHLLRMVLYLFVATALAFTFSRQILEFLAAPLEGGLSAMVAIDPTEPVGVVMKVSLLSGLVLALPLIVFEIYLFMSQGLKVQARKWGLAAIPVVVLFFVGGMAFAYYVMLPTALPFLLSIMGITTQIRPSSYLGFVTGILFWVGVAFEFPLVIFLLASLGWINAKTLASQWRLAIVIIAVISALITPTVDPVNMSLIMLPLIALFFLSVLLAKLAQIGRARREQPD